MASTNKYDRQLRLWGAAGQESLGTSHVIMVGAEGAAGTETLKNLILPGIGSFAIVDTAPPAGPADPSCVTPRSNFFIVDPTLPLAASVASSLAELNPEVASSHHVPEPESHPSLHDFIASASPSGLRAYITSPPPTAVCPYPPPPHPLPSGATATTLIIANDLPPPSCAALSALAKELSLPLLLVRTYGLLGEVRVQSGADCFATLEPRPDADKPDLRIPSAVSGSFPELLAFAEARLGKMKDMDEQQHAHVPYPVLLIAALRSWKEQKGTDAPASFAEKNEFRDLLKSMSRNVNLEMNFAEAGDNAHLAWADSGVSDDVAEYLEMPAAKDPTSTSPPFFILLHTLSKYIAQHGATPLNGAVPDMTSMTDDYVELQNLYLNKSKADAAAFTTILHSVLSSLSLPASAVPPSTTSTFIKNIPSLRVVPSSPYALSAPPSPESCESVQEASWDPYPDAFEHSPVWWYLGLRAAEAYYEKTGEWPGRFYEEEGRAKEEEIEALARMFEDLVKAHGLELGAADDEASLNAPLVTKISTELCRLNHAENHNVASIVGGVGSQEAVKIVTQQMVPICNTYTFNGIAGTAAVFRG